MKSATHHSSKFSSSHVYVILYQDWLLCRSRDSRLYHDWLCCVSRDTMCVSLWVSVYTVCVASFRSSCYCLGLLNTPALLLSCRKLLVVGAEQAGAGPLTRDWAFGAAGSYIFQIISQWALCLQGPATLSSLISFYCVDLCYTMIYFKFA